MKIRVIYDWLEKGLEIEAESLDAAKDKARELGYEPLDAWEILPKLSRNQEYKELLEDWQTSNHECSFEWFCRVYN